MFDLTEWPPDRVAQNDIDRELAKAKRKALGIGCAIFLVMYAVAWLISTWSEADEPSLTSSPRPAWCQMWLGDQAAIDEYDLEECR